MIKSKAGIRTETQDLTQSMFWIGEYTFVRTTDKKNPVEMNPLTL